MKMMFNLWVKWGFTLKLEGDWHAFGSQAAAWHLGTVVIEVEIRKCVYRLLSMHIFTCAPYFLYFFYIYIYIVCKQYRKYIYIYTLYAFNLYIYIFIHNYIHALHKIILISHEKTHG